MSVRTNLITKCLWPSYLACLFITGVHSLDCSFLNIHLRGVTWQNVRFLNSMKGPFRLECLKDTNDFELPEEIFSYNQSKKWNIKLTFFEIYANVFHIFSQYIAKSSWEAELLQQFLMELNLQAEYLEGCLEEERENKDMKYGEIKHTGVMLSWKDSLQLKRYFYKMHNYLKDKNYSDCAWKIVFVETGRCFYRSLKLTTLLGKK